MSIGKDPKSLALIQAVRKNRALYDVAHENFQDADHTNGIWASVARRCGYDNAADVKNAWKEFNTSFIKCHRNKLIQKGRGNCNENEFQFRHLQPSDLNNWEYYNEMRFIIPFIMLNKAHEENNLDSSHCNQSENDNIHPITITSIRASAETQTPLENIRMDIPPICEEHLTDNELCLRSYFDAIYRATCSLPVKWQNKVKREMLQSLNSAEILADADRRAALRAKQEGN